MSRLKFLGIVIALALVLGLVGQAMAVTKSLDIKPGWNLLNLPIDPTNKAPQQLLAQLKKYKSVWSWNAGEKKWRVYLAEQDSQTYAQDKGFDVLQSISAGEGFWVQSIEQETQTLTIEGQSPASDVHQLVAGWNLIGLKSDGTVTVSSLLNTLVTSGINAKSLWAWDTTNGKWKVHIPSYSDTQLNDYISKGFSALTQVTSTEGFWVNASQGGSVTETPPEVGKAYKSTGENTYIPLANADVYVNGIKIGTTDSNGNFKLPDDLKATDVITIGNDDKFTIAASELKSGALYIFAQDQDKNKVLLESTGGAEKPVPKTITSADGKASITIKNLQLTKDITVAVTPYKTPLSLPKVGDIKNLNPNFMVVAGADVSFVDSKGKAISEQEAGFSGVVNGKAKNFLGEFTGEVLYNYLGQGDPTKAVGELYILAYADGQWVTKGTAELKEDTAQSKGEDVSPTKTYYLTSAADIGGLYPFAFVFKQDYLIGEVEVTVTNKGLLYKSASGDQLVTEGTDGKGAVPDESYGDPVKGALVTTDNSDEYAVTDANGKAKVKYILPPSNPNLGILVKKDGYFDEVATINVVDEGSKAVQMAELPDTAAVGGMVYDKITNNGIAGAKVTLKNPIVLDKIVDDGETITVGLDDTATYKWELRKQGAENWVKILEEQGKNSITRTQIKEKLIDNWANLTNDEKAAIGANPIGTYDLRITVTHPFENYTYVESAEGYLDITIDMAKLDETASLSEGQLGAVSVFGGKDIGFYYATAPVASDLSYTWTVEITSWDDADSNDEADEGEVEVLAESEPVKVPFFPFIEAINLVQKNYLKLLVPPEGGWNDPNVNDENSYLKEGVSVDVIFEASYTLGDLGLQQHKVKGSFDLVSEDPLATLIVGKLQIIPNTTMAFEETQYTDEAGKFLFAFVDPQLSGMLGLYGWALAYKPNQIFLTAEGYPLLKGWITEANLGLEPVELPPEPGAEPEPIDVTQAAQLEWVETWEDAVQVEPQGITGVAGYWTVSGNDINDIQWWALQNPENYGPAAISGIDYPVPEGETKANLLPAFEGEYVAWFGSKTTFTFTDTNSNTSDGKKDGKLASPVIDLSNFSFATLQFATWWEVESVDVAKWQFDQMKVLVCMPEATAATPITIGNYKFNGPDDCKIVAFMNPDTEVPIQKADTNYSSGGNDALPVWLQWKVNLNPFAGHKIKLVFDFDTKDSLFNGFRGWAVDDIRISNDDNDLPFNIYQPSWWYWKTPVRSE